MSRATRRGLSLGFLVLVIGIILARVVAVPTARADRARNDTATVRISPPAVAVKLNQAFSVELWINGATQLGGYQVDLTFDPALLTVTQVVPGTFLAGPDRTVINLGPAIDSAKGVVTVGGVSYGTGGGASGGGLLATIHFRAGSIPGTCPLTLINLQVIRVDGTLQAARVEGASVTIEPESTPTPTPTRTPTPTSTPTPTPAPTATGTPGTGTIASVVMLQGRTNHSGATISVDGTPVATTTADGSFSATGVSPGIHTVTASHPGYLSAENASVPVASGVTTTLFNVTLPGGDTDNDGRVNIFDLVRVGVHYGEHPPGDPRADINEDGWVNIFDLTMVGVNYGRTGPTDWPGP